MNYNYNFNNTYYNLLQLKCETLKWQICMSSTFATKQPSRNVWSKGNKAHYCGALYWMAKAAKRTAVAKKKSLTKPVKERPLFGQVLKVEDVQSPR